MPDQPSSPRVFSYSRISVADSKTGSYSLSWQRDTIRDWCAARGLEITQEFEENGESAANIFESRRDGGQLVARAVNNGDKVVVARLDRGFRDVLDFRFMTSYWQKMGVELVSATEHVDLSTPAGLMMGTMIVAVAEYERTVIVQRQVNAVAARKRAGLRTTTDALYGWRFVPTGHIGADGEDELRPEPDPEEQLAIRHMIALRNRYASYRVIAGEMDETRWRPRRGGSWSHSSVADILGDLDRHLYVSHHTGEAPPPAE